MRTPDLKPCPFCGGEGMLFSSGNYWPIEYYRVICKKGGCCFMSAFYEEPKRAIDAWNRRAGDEDT